MYIKHILVDKITNMLSVNSHLTITNFNAMIFRFKIFSVVQVFFWSMRSAEGLGKIASAGNLVQVSFRFGAAESSESDRDREVRVGTWAGKN